MPELNPRIAVEAGKMGGKPCIRGLRFTVNDLASYLAPGMTEDEILKEFAYLEKEDFQAVHEFFARFTVITDQSGSATVSLPVRPHSLSVSSRDFGAWVGTASVQPQSRKTTTSPPSWFCSNSSTRWSKRYSRPCGAPSQKR